MFADERRRGNRNPSPFDHEILQFEESIFVSTISEDDHANGRGMMSLDGMQPFFQQRPHTAHVHGHPHGKHFVFCCDQPLFSSLRSGNIGELA
jgi:hypothetical protein